MTSFHCPNCQRGWHQGVTRDHQETWCWVCQGNAHQTTTEERDSLKVEVDRLRSVLQTIVDGAGDPDIDPEDIAKEALRLKEPYWNCQRCCPGEDCPDDCLDRNHRVTDN